MKLKQLFETKKCAFSLEVFPPKKNGGDPSTLYPALDEMKLLNPDYISVTYGAAGGPAGMSTVQIASHIKNVLGIEPLAHLTCINSEPEDVHKVLQALKEQGVQNVLALRGDRCPDAHPERSYQHASDLMQVIAQTGDFYMAGACYPEGHVESPTEEESFESLYKKQEAGADYLVSQLFFDNEDFYRFRETCLRHRVRLPIVAGIMPFTSVNQIQRMAFTCGASIPAKVVKRLVLAGDDPADQARAGVEYACEQLCDLAANGVDGCHVYSMNKPPVAHAAREALAACGYLGA